MESVSSGAITIMFDTVSVKEKLFVLIPNAGPKG